MIDEPLTETHALSESPQVRGWTTLCRHASCHWPVLIPLMLFAIAAMIVPTMTNVATTDDWGYTRSVEILLNEGHLRIFPVVAATAVGQVLWGALFGLIFGMSLGVMRLSTVVMVALGAIALYAILRQLGVSRSRSSTGMALWLFNPLGFVLSFTFMTDPHFTSVLLISLAFLIRGLNPDDERGRLIVLGAVVAGFAFLIRQQGAFIPAAVLIWLMMSRRLPLSREGLRRGAQVALAPLIVGVSYLLWLKLFNDVPAVQQGFLDELINAGWSGTWLLIQRLPFYSAMYLGIFLIPVIIAILPEFRERMQGRFFTSPVGYWLFLGWTSALATMFFLLSRRGFVMPYIPQFVGRGGFGPPDIPGSRPRLVEDGLFINTITIVSLVGAIVMTLLLARYVHDARQILHPRRPASGTPANHAAGLIVIMAAGQFVGMLPPSYHYLNRGITLDRYMLPLIPLAITLMLWALRDVHLVQPLVWIGIALFAVVSTAGTRDYLVLLDGIWDMAHDANARGVENTQLDAGAGWDGYHLYTLMLDEGITKAKSPPGSPWWIYFYAKPTDSAYVVTTKPSKFKAYVIVEQKQVEQWLDDDPVNIYLVRKPDSPWPIPSKP